MFRPEVPKHNKKKGEFERYKQSFITYARHLRLYWVFMRDNKTSHVGDPNVATKELEIQHGRDVVSAHV